jgi:hypothetical protein
MPVGDVVALVTGSGDGALAPTAVTEAATLFFRCDQGVEATVHYGAAFQVCPGDGGLLGIDLPPQPEPLPLRVTAPQATTWSLSVAADSS